MRIEAPGFRIRIKNHTEGEARNSEEALHFVKEELAEQGLKLQPGGAGWALMNLFGRMVELVFNRLDQVPEKHFL
ncbi:MAG: hypothetical protein JRH07_05730, partial [Deltaproteobacteria bacterium]|nr:hypothetical protein [Deltaproteobacteria bacterium]